MNSAARNLGPRHRLGFNLIELVLVTAIVGTLAAMAVPRFSEAQTRYRAELAARRVVADLALARSTARTESEARGLAFDTTNDLYTLPQIVDLDDSSNATYTVTLSNSPMNADLVAAWFGGDPLLTFDMFGVPDSDGIVVLRTGNEYRAVVLDADGNAEVRLLTKAEALPLESLPPLDPGAVGSVDY